MASKTQQASTIEDIDTSFNHLAYDSMSNGNGRVVIDK